MGERGPLPVPHARRRNKRVATGKRVLVAQPEMPPTLAAEAKAEWERVVPELEHMGLLASVDRSVLIRYCTVWADWCELDQKLQQTGKLIRGRHQGRSDGLVRNPLWMMRSDAEATLSDLGRQLGLTPAARLRVGVVHEEPDEDDERVGVTAIAEYRRRLGG